MGAGKVTTIVQKESVERRVEERLYAVGDSPYAQLSVSRKSALFSRTCSANVVQQPPVDPVVERGYVLKFNVGVPVSSQDKGILS